MKTLIGIDFSQPGVGAGDWVSRWLLPDAPLVLAYSIQVPASPSFTSVHDEGHDVIVDRAREEAQRALAPIVQEFGPERTEVAVGEGPPADALLRMADRVEAELVVVGPHGHGPGLLGSTAAQLIRSSPIPVLVVREPASRAPRRILVAVDDQDMTTAVLAWAKRIHDLHPGDVTGLYVYETLLAGLPVFSGPSGEVDLAVGLEDAAGRWLKEVLTDAGIPEGHMAAQVGQGHAGAEICAAAEDQEADLIIMGTHGRPLAGPTIGSVARYVVGHAGCPVLVIPKSR